MKLIDNWRQSWKFWSIRLGLIGTALTAAFLQFPESALFVWSMFPEDLKAHLPPVVVNWVAVVLLIGSMIARVISQEKLRIKNDSNRDREEDNQE